MGIKIEFNPDLALRRYEKHLSGERLAAECVPVSLEVGQTYDFLKEGQRNYWLEGELPLLYTEGNSKLSRPIASIIILEVSHFMNEGKLYTKGKYLVKETFDMNDDKIHFDGFSRVNL